VPIKPILQALVLADRVYTDAITRKKVISGTFNQIVGDIPGTYKDRSDVFICLTDVHPKAQMDLDYVDLITNEVLMRFSITAESSNALASVELGVNVPQLPMPHEGVFAFELHSEGEPLGSLRVHAKKAPG
jgi:hypothetical protein